MTPGLTATQFGCGSPASSQASPACGWSTSKMSHQVKTGKLIWMRGFRNAVCKRLITTASPLPLVQYGAWGSRFELKSSSCLACMLTRIVATIRLCCRCFGGDNFEALRKHQIPRKPKCVNTWVFVILARSHFFCA